jgi:hypothetical protein
MVTVDATCTTDMMKPSEKSESEEYMTGDAYRVTKQAYDKEDKTMTTRDAGLTQEPVEAAEVHAAGSSHCGEIKSKSAFSRDSTRCPLGVLVVSVNAGPHALQRMGGICVGWRGS